MIVTEKVKVSISTLNPVWCTEKKRVITLKNIKSRQHKKIRQIALQLIHRHQIFHVFLSLVSTANNITQKNIGLDLIANV